MSPAYREHERRALVEGLALGCLANGIHAITTNRNSLRGAMAYTATTWSARARYRTLSGLDLDAYLWSGSYPASSSGARAVWVTGRWLRPRLVVVGTELDVSGLDGLEAVELARWCEMAALFTSRLNDSEKLTDEPSEIAVGPPEAPARVPRPRNGRNGRSTRSAEPSPVTEP